MPRKNKVKIISCGSVVDTQVKINGLIVKDCQIIRYKFTEKEQALIVVYLESAKGNKKYYKSGEAIEKQYLFRSNDAKFNFNIKNIYKQINLIVKDNKPVVKCNGKKIKGICSINWQMNALSDIHEFELNIA